MVVEEKQSPSIVHSSSGMAGATLDGRCDAGGTSLHSSRKLKPKTEQDQNHDTNRFHWIFMGLCFFRVAVPGMHINKTTWSTSTIPQPLGKTKHVRRAWGNVLSVNKSKQLLGECYCPFSSFATAGKHVICAGCLNVALGCHIHRPCRM